MNTIRPISVDDVEVLTELVIANRSFMARWDPVFPESYYTIAGQRHAVEAALELQEQGSALVYAICDDGGVMVGRITLNGIVRGPFQSCSVGYWVAQAMNGRGLATSALSEMKQIAFGELDPAACGARAATITSTSLVGARAETERGEGHDPHGPCPSQEPLSTRYRRSKRSRFMTLSQAATKSSTNLPAASA
ncbi:MAG: GNAT family N-acetyltransferase, partial [Actinomycetes bacterium]